MSEFYSEPMRPVAETDLDAIFGRELRNASQLRIDLRDQVIAKMTRVGDLHRIRLEDNANGRKMTLDERRKKWNSIRSLLVSEAKRQKWLPDEKGHYLRVKVRKDEHGDEWMWVQRLGPHLAYSNVPRTTVGETNR